MADTISILVATDNHVGAHERDPIRGDDSWRSFHEIMCLAKERDVDMVLLAGDLFHENKPSRKSMYNVMRSLRLNCLGDKPCELEMLSDESEHFDPTFDHVNYEDANINVGIPVFSIHGNHDDPTGHGHFAALDLLAVSGLINYYGKIPESNNISVKPVLIQKGSTKLALYGLSNVRDERLYQTFRENQVVFHRPSTQMKDWYNLICVHQNHHAHTETSYLPENFLPDFLDLVIWGHEHECIIQPQLNPEMNFQVIQPGSSIATSLIPGEAIPKHVTILTITGRDMHSEPIRLKSVRPFVYKDIALGADKVAVKLAEKDNHRTKITQHLMNIVEEMIEEARTEWLEAQDQDSSDEPPEFPLPLIRLRVETSFPDGKGRFDVENPQRFSNRFIDKVANTSDVIQFHVRKRNATAAKTTNDAEAAKAIMAKYTGVDNVQVDELVKEFLEAQSLTILPQNCFGDAVSQYVIKDDKHAMELFVNEALTTQIKTLVNLQADGNDDDDDEDLAAQINEQRAKLEELFVKGELILKKSRLKPKPVDWDSDLEGEWANQPGAVIRADDDMQADEDEGSAADTPAPRAATSARGRGRARGGRVAAATSRRAATTAATAAITTTTTRKSTAAGTARGHKRAVPSDEEDDEDEDIVMFNDQDNQLSQSEEDNSQAMFFPDKRDTRTAPKTATGARGRGTATSATSSTRGRNAPAAKKPPARAAASKAKQQSTLSFTTSQNSILGNGRASGHSGRAISEDIEDDDDDDAFEPVSTVRSRRR